MLTHPAAHSLPLLREAEEEKKIERSNGLREIHGWGLPITIVSKMELAWGKNDFILWSAHGLFFLCWLLPSLTFPCSGGFPHRLQILQETFNCPTVVSSICLHLGCSAQLWPAAGPLELAGTSYEGAPASPHGGPAAPCPCLGTCTQYVYTFILFRQHSVSPFVLLLILKQRFFI